MKKFVHPNYRASATFTKVVAPLLMVDLISAMCIFLTLLARQILNSAKEHKLLQLMTWLQDLNHLDQRIVVRAMERFQVK